MTFYFHPVASPCDTKNGGCHVNATCEDNNGTAKCNCINGYEGNGTNCTGMFFNLLAVMHCVNVSVFCHLFILYCMTDYNKDL